MLKKSHGDEAVNLALSCGVAWLLLLRSNLLSGAAIVS